MKTEFDDIQERDVFGSIGFVIRYGGMRKRFGAPIVDTFSPAPRKGVPDA